MDHDLNLHGPVRLESVWLHGPSFALIKLLCTAALMIAGLACARAAEPGEIRIAYLRQPEPRITLSLLQTPADNDGVAGAQMAIDDNNTTGRFLNQRFALEEVRLREKDDPVAAVLALADRGVSLVIADLSPEALLKAADAGRQAAPRMDFSALPAGSYRLPPIQPVGDGALLEYARAHRVAAE